MEALGNIYLYRGIYYKDKKEKETAMSEILKSKEIFVSIYSNDHPVFTFIDSTIDLIKK